MLVKCVSVRVCVFSMCICAHVRNCTLKPFASHVCWQLFLLQFRLKRHLINVDKRFVCPMCFLSMLVCVRVRIHICICRCVCVCVYERMYVHLYARKVFVCVCVCV